MARHDLTSEGLIRSFTAANTIVANRIVAYGATDGEVTATTVANGLAAGIALNSASAGQTVDVLMQGISRCYAGGIVARGGELVVDDTDGFVDDFTVADEGTPVFSLGRALEAATADGDLISVLIQPHWTCVA